MFLFLFVNDPIGVFDIEEHKEWEENNRITGAAHYDMGDGDYDGVTKEGMEICLRNWHRQMSKEDYAKYKVEIIN